MTCEITYTNQSNRAFEPHRNRRVAEKAFFEVETLRSQRLRGSNACCVVKNLLEFYSVFKKLIAYRVVLKAEI